MKTLREYASHVGVSYEAVRKQLKRYAPELEGHIKKERGVQYLDDFAIDFLTEKRNAQPVVIVNKDQAERIIELEKNLAVAQALLKQRDNDVLKAQNLASERLLEISNLKHLEKENERLETALNDARDEAKTNRGEADSYKTKYDESQKEVEFLNNRGFWARVFNKKYKKNKVGSQWRPT